MVNMYKQINEAITMLEFGLVDEAISLLKTIRKPGSTRQGRKFVSNNVRKYVKELKKKESQ